MWFCHLGTPSAILRKGIAGRSSLRSGISGKHQLHDAGRRSVNRTHVAPWVTLVVASSTSPLRSQRAHTYSTRSFRDVKGEYGAQRGEGCIAHAMVYTNARMNESSKRPQFHIFTGGNDTILRTHAQFQHENERSPTEFLP